MIKSEVIKGTLQDELERNDRMISRYENEVDNLPKGSLVVRTLSNRDYVYLTSREGKKVVSKYIGPIETVDVDELEKSIKERRRLMKVLRELKKEKMDLERILN